MLWNNDFKRFAVVPTTGTTASWSIIVDAGCCTHKDVTARRNGLSIGRTNGNGLSLELVETITCIINLIRPALVAGTIPNTR